MKSKVFFLLCIMLIITLLAACTGRDSNSNHVTTIETEGMSTKMEQSDYSNPEIESSSESAVTKKELLEEDERFKNLLDSLNANDFSKIQIDRAFGGTDEIQTFCSEDPAIIQQWVALLKKMKTSSKPFEIITGGGYLIQFYEGENKIDIGNFTIPYIYNSTTRTMNIIENYSELQVEFNDLLKKVIA